MGWLCRGSAVGATLPLPGALERFDDWAERNAGAATPRAREALIAQGVTLARARREVLASLISRDPELALSRALAPRMVRGLPPSVSALLEERIDSVGSFDVLALCSRVPGGPTRIERTVRLDGRSFRAHVFGAALGWRSQAQLPLHGIALDGELALSDLPLKRPVPSPLPSGWTVGTKKALYIRVDFSDSPGDPLTSADAQAAMTQVNSFLHAASYNLLSVVTTVTPTLRVPGTHASYESNNDYTQLMDDARAAAASAGFSNAAYDFDLIAFRGMPSWGWAGLGYVGSKGLWLNGSFTWSTAAHELGHNLGLSHANFWQAPGETIIGAGTSVEYGNPFDVMGSGEGQFNAWDKSQLDWLPPADVAVAAGSTSYRIYDLEALTSGGFHALRVPISGVKDYWVEYRPNGGSAASAGASINWGYSSPGVSDLLDMAPWTALATDSPLTLGRTFADEGDSIYVTPTGKGGTSPESLDVTVSVGFSLSNQPPTASLGASAAVVAKSQPVVFTVSATDPNGDTLAYDWDFGDGSASTNVATLTRYWATDRDVVARVTVSDMKGGTATASTLVQVGSPGTRRISGLVLENGNGVAGAKVAAGSRYAFSDSTGGYTLTGLPSGSFTVTASKAGWTITPAGFTNPVVVASANVSGIDFTGSRATYSISGSVTSAGAAAPGVTVSAGTYSAVTNGAGAYVLGGVPNGTYAVSASLAGRTFKEQGFTNPVQVAGANLSGRNFYELVFDLSGEVTGLPGPHSVADGVRAATTALVAGHWRYTLGKVPPGSWNLVGTAPGLTLAPSFQNPVLVTTSALTGLDFVADAGTSWLVTGYIQEGGQPLPGVFVDGGVASSTTDTLGNFALVGVTDGTYSLTPYLPGYQFTPGDRSVTVAGADAPGNDFGVLNANSPPTVVIPARASANPVPADVVTLSVLGDDDDGEGNLTYTWATKFATAPVTYQHNGSNAAKSTQVTFAKAGAYSFEATLKDLGGLAVKSAVSVFVSQTAATVVVTPPSATVELGSDKQFLAALNDQFGDGVDVAELPQWSVSDGGTLTAVGRFTATAAGGPYTVSATLAGITGSAQVTVVVGPVPRVVQAAAAEPNPVAGDVSRLTVLGDDDQGESGLTYRWSAVNPPAAVTFDPNNSNAAKASLATFAREGTYNLKVDLKDATGLSVSSFVTVVVTRGTVKLLVNPAAGTVAPGGTVQFGYRCLDQVNADVVPLPAASWGVTGGGSIDGNGLFTAGGDEGQAVVTCTVGLKSSQATVTVSAQGAADPAPTPPPKGCGCGGAGQGALAPFALAALAIAAARRRSSVHPERSEAKSSGGPRLRSGKTEFVAGLSPRLRSGRTELLLLLTLASCSGQAIPVEAPSSTSRQPLGEVVAGYPNDFERMLLVLTNQARHSATTPNGNECGDWTSEQGASVKLRPLVWNQQAAVGARFTSKHLSELGCFQHDSCCELGDAGGGSIQCVSAGECTGSGCNKTCDAGPGSTAADRYRLFGFNSYASESVAGNQGSPYEAWCSWMQTDGDRQQNIYGAFTQAGTGAYQAPATACSGWYWTEGFGDAPVSVPSIPAASAMFSPPNPANTSALYFAANYYDSSGRRPRRSEVVVSGHCFDLDRAWGFDDNGTYEAHFLDPDVLPEGCHPYYFFFLGADGGRSAYPETGSLEVALGQTASCALPYDPSPQKEADCETGVQQCPASAQQACYTADPATLARGECRQGWQSCRDGFWSACRDMIGPFPETCDGLDNDCDGQVDEGDPGAGESCEGPLERGECKAGVLHCLSGRLACVGLQGPQSELCDGKDNDCDGAVDDGFPIVTCGQGECFRTVAGCENGVPGVCVPGSPSAEVADFKDNDCDGVIDNGVDCRLPDGGLGYPRPCVSYSLRTPDGGTRVPSLPCKPGTQLCQADAGWGACLGEVAPSPEVCDGVDNDCDGEIDENGEIGWERCGIGDCVKFTARCSGGSPVTCSARAPSPEVCNGVDDNCDGVVDEGCSCRLGDTHPCYTAPVTTRGVGLCHAGVRNCVDGGYGACEGEVTPGDEWCDNLDNDCDGVVDNACAPIPPDAGPWVDAGSAGIDAGEVADAGQAPPKGGGCGCAGSPGAESVFLAALLALGWAVGRRRRRT